MTKEQALEVKEIVDQCVSTIPGQYVDRVWHYYITYIDPTRNRQSRPCTCSPGQWTGFLFALKDKVTDVLNSNTANLEDLSKDAQSI